MTALNPKPWNAKPAPQIADSSILSFRQGGRCTARRKRDFKPPWCEAGPLHYHDDKVNSDQWVVNREPSLPRVSGTDAVADASHRGDGKRQLLLAHQSQVFNHQ